MMTTAKNTTKQKQKQQCRKKVMRRNNKQSKRWHYGWIINRGKLKMLKSGNDAGMTNDVRR